MSWLFTGDEEVDRKLRVGYESVIHTTLLPQFYTQEYRDFLDEVRYRQLEAPFYSNVSAAQVSHVQHQC